MTDSSDTARSQEPGRRRTPPWQVVAAYAAGSFAVLEAVDLFSGRFDLPGWLFSVALALLILGLPVSLLAVRAFDRADGDDSTATAGGARGRGSAARGSPPRYALTWRAAGVAFIGALAVWGVFAGGWMAVTAEERRALELRNLALLELPRLAEAGDYEAAHALALEVERAIGDDSVITALREQFSARVDVESRPAGAVLYRKPYDGEAWERLGETPLTTWLPKNTSRIRLEKPGYRTAEAVLFNLYGPVWWQPIQLEPEDSEVPADMVWVSGGTISVGSPGLEHLPRIALADYYLDRYEVTNRDYAGFLETGGYHDPSWWREPFRDAGRDLSFEEAMARFTDRTGRPGPATWEGGTYPSGTGDLPVGGLSWYEAAAFARFAGAELPTIYHWFHAAFTWLSPYVVGSSNYRGNGPAAAGVFDGMARFGAYDMGGNVREWVWNSAGEERYILGGGWNDEPYTFVDPVSHSPFDRSSTNGLRLSRYTAERGLEEARMDVPLPSRDYATETHAGDEAFAIYRRMFDYDRQPLNAVVELADTTGDWIRERVTFDAAYGADRVIAHVFLPTNVEPPYQTVLYFPGSYGFRGGSSEPPPDIPIIDFIVRSGRALIRPVFKSTFERQDHRSHDQPDMTVDYRDHVVMWAKDMRRAIDYAEERPDLDAGRLAYFGGSWGGRMGGLMVPVEPRFDAAVLYVAGLKFQRSLPEADPWNFLPRFTTPVLMLNGRDDNFFPVETSQKPMFEAIATDPEHKRYVLYDGGHFVPRVALVQETLNWLDRYLGPVR